MTIDDEGNPPFPLKSTPTPSSDAQWRPDPASFNAPQIVSESLDCFNKAIESPTIASLQNVMFPNAFWRDHLFLTWDLRTLHGLDKISTYLSGPETSKKLASVKITPTTGNYKRQPFLDPSDTKSFNITAFIDVESDEGVGEGIIKLFLDGDNNWKVFNIYTALVAIKGHPEHSGLNRPHGGLHGDQSNDPRNWKERLEWSVNFTDSSPTVLVVGAGQADLTVAARLKQLDIPTLVIDKNPRIGDNWRNRYHSLVLHDPVWYDHLPYLPFPKTWPIFTPKDKLGDWLEHYAATMELAVWTSTTVGPSEYRDGKWTIKLSRNGEERTLTPRHVILCTGQSGEPNIVNFENEEAFPGPVTHSSKWTGPERLRGKKVIVIGAGNTGHDIAHSLVSSGAFPTIVQRSSTHVSSSDIGLKTLLGSLYFEGGPEAEEADLLAFSTPNSVLKGIAQMITTGLRAMDKDGPMLAGLEKVGFRINDGPDGAGLLFQYFECGGSYYIDIGASAMIAEGQIGLKHANINKFTEKGILFDDGEELEAAEIVVATGYKNMRTTAGIVFPCVKGCVNVVGGMDEEGETRTLFRDSGHPGFWFMGMNLAHCRYFSRLLALRIAGEELGLSTPRYK
ncbi:hypothetical protein DRE_00049 [Drechslerella stenobrocha 248]|uniref:FAD/NAD(P)-binding domain-containing protein n=1 Tax=Drechslerella stenobrocha 248 TaxID=1043628 RepID=W7HZ03_9PEZI|nr:hypothetical protein DRE_00049 [Drechslerella stenobrocha 248]